MIAHNPANTTTSHFKGPANYPSRPDQHTRQRPQKEHEPKDDLPPPTQPYTWYTSIKGSSAIIDAKGCRVLRIESKRIARDIIAKGLPKEAISYLRARRPLDIDPTADDIMHTTQITVP